MEEVTKSSWSIRVLEELLDRIEKSAQPDGSGSNLARIYLDGPSQMQLLFRVAFSEHLLGVQLKRSDVPIDISDFTSVGPEEAIGTADPAALAFDIIYLLVEQPHPDRAYSPPDDQGVRWLLAFRER